MAAAELQYEELLNNGTQQSHPDTLHWLEALDG